MGKVIYLTGAPAAGKSTLMRSIRREMSDIFVFEYGVRMAAHLKRTGDPASTQHLLRGGTAGRVNEADIQQVNAEMIRYAAKHRSKGNVIIDSHHVTQEPYGFRVAPFSPVTLAKLALSEIWVLVTPPHEVVRRIRADSRGRPVPSEWHSTFHAIVQADLASQYAVLTGAPMLLFDSEVSLERLLEVARARLT